ncbi:hypothetical protein DLH72_03990 [Candidatus Gracilibacteria bacterium]|nr:MAG: hypothetical protein DLH72_03990 [Candidatus Gracilibacteria bacterium]
MKTIQISDELYEKLEKISKEMNNQNHRGTRMPYNFQIIQEKIKITAEGYQDGYHYWSSELEDGFYVWDNEEEGFLEKALAFIDEYFSDEESKLKRDDYFEVFSFLTKRNIQEIPVKKSRDYIGNFLTHESAKRHFEANKHHYSGEFQDYLVHLWRDPDMEAVQQFLCELTGGKLHT